MTKEETIQVLKSIEDRATDFPYMTACDWVTIAAAKRHLTNSIEVKDRNSVWHSIDDIPNFNHNGISDLIIDSCYGHICREAHYYTPERWDIHIGFNTNRQFRWAYEKDLINFE